MCFCRSSSAIMASEMPHSMHCRVMPERDDTGPAGDAAGRIGAAAEDDEAAMWGGTTGTNDCTRCARPGRIVFSNGAAAGCFAFTGESVRSTAATVALEAGLTEDVTDAAVAAGMLAATGVCLASSSSSEKSSISIDDGGGGTGREAVGAVRCGSTTRDGRGAETAAMGRVR
jgi:hypothetical protein